MGTGKGTPFFCGYAFVACADCGFALYCRNMQYNQMIPEDIENCTLL